MDPIVNPAKELASMGNGSPDRILVRNVKMDSVSPEVWIDGHGLGLSSCFLCSFQVDINYHQAHGPVFREAQACSSADTTGCDKD